MFHPPTHGEPSQSVRRRWRGVLAASLLLAAPLACDIGQIGPFLTQFFLEASDDVGPFQALVDAELETVVADADFPVSMVFLPDGTLLYVEKNTGRVRAVRPDGTLQAEAVIDLPTTNVGDEGLLGLEIDPDFASNGFVYVGVTANELPLDNPLPRTSFRIVRFTYLDGQAVTDSELSLAELPASGLPGHEGGNLHFGHDGKLYLSVGDRRLNTFPNDEAQDAGALAGKMLRFNADGSIPADNPFGGDNPVFAIGLRNSFDFAFDPQSGSLLASENGANGDDELNLIEAGGNYGWPRTEGFADRPAEQAFAADEASYRDPLVILGAAPTGVAFNPADAYGAAYQDDLFVGEYVSGRIKWITLTDDRRSVASADVFASGIPGGINDIAFGPDGLMYISTAAAIYRIAP